MTGSDSSLLKADVFFDCGGPHFPIAVAIPPTIVSATEAQFLANWDAGFRLSCGAGQGKFTVLANDGFDFSDFTDPAATSPSGLVSKKPPVASICDPADGTVVLVNQPVVLCGKGYDAEDGNNTTDSWTVTGPGGYQTTATGDHVDLQPPGTAHQWAPGRYTAM